MPKRHPKFDLKWIIGSIAGVGVLSGAIVGVARYLTLPERVEAVEKTTNEISEYIQQQQIYNKAVQDILSQKSGKEEVVLSPDKKLYWNDTSQEWRPVRELDK